MQPSVEYTTLPLAEGVHSIEMQMVRAFLVVGSVSALLIDTGAGGVNLRQAVREVTDLPVRIVNTHAHFDHISGNSAFEMVFAHPKEIATIAKAGYMAQPVSDGNGFDLGDRILQVISLPGHSPGSIGLWDAERGYLFAGDAIAKGRPVFLSLEGASMEAFSRSLDRILSLAEDADGGRLTTLFCAHGEATCGLDTVMALKQLAEQVTNGEATLHPLPELFSRQMAESSRLVKAGDVSLLVSI